MALDDPLNPNKDEIFIILENLQLLKFKSDLSLICIFSILHI